MIIMEIGMWGIMKPVKKFMKYLEKELPNNYYGRCSPEGKKITILNQNNEYVYLFYKQEIEEDFELCCSLINTIIKESNL